MLSGLCFPSVVFACSMRAFDRSFSICFPMLRPVRERARQSQSQSAPSTDPPNSHGHRRGGEDLRHLHASFPDYAHLFSAARSELGWEPRASNTGGIFVNRSRCFALTGAGIGTSGLPGGPRRQSCAEHPGNHREIAVGLPGEDTPLRLIPPTHGRSPSALRQMTASGTGRQL